MENMAFDDLPPVHSTVHFPDQDDEYDEDREVCSFCWFKLSSSLS